MSFYFVFIVVILYSIAVPHVVTLRLFTYPYTLCHFKKNSVSQSASQTVSQIFAVVVDAA